MNSMRHPFCKVFLKTFNCLGIQLFPFIICVILMLVEQVPTLGAVSENLLRNPSFEEGVNEIGLPVGWQLYGALDKARRIILVEQAHTGRKAIMIEDSHPGEEIGLMQTIPIKPNLTYEASAMVRAVEGTAPYGAYLQLRFLPSNKFVQTSLAATSTKEFERVSVKATAPPDTESAVIYLYTHRNPIPKVIVDSVSLVSGVEPPPPPPPEPIPPVYTKLKDLHIRTELVKDGKPNITILTPASGIYDRQAARIQRAIHRMTGVTVPIASDASPEGSLPLKGNLIALGNRSTNKTISELYNRFYVILDLRYPGLKGYVVRTLHNPFGNGKNVIFIGGSDLAGVQAGTEVFIGKLQESQPRKGNLSIGWLAEIKLGEDIRVPKDLKEFEIWEASKGYGSIGYFGWNSLSKRLAMYYMTGEEFHAREFLRLAFPDAQAKKEITEIDGERIENKDEPLSGPYHYNAHMMILFWDLVEESPAFTDEERLKVTNAFAKQLLHRKDEGIYGLTEPPPGVGSRHAQWSAISLYCLGRYFQRDYPNPIWQHCMDSARLHFAPLHKHAWVSGESDNLFWYNTATEPILNYMLLTGDRKPLENGVLATLLRGQEILISGLQPDWALDCASIGFLHKAAYLTQDGRWLEYLRRTGLDLKGFRLGQSFWPEEHLKPKKPMDLVGKWSIHRLPVPMWLSRNSGLSLEESFQFASFRSAPNGSGDFILLDGFNGASRNPYHTFAILELRLAGQTILQGYLNQVLTRADGLVEPEVAMDAALRSCDVIGNSVIAVGEVPKAAFCNWRRILLQRIGHYALVVDDLKFRTDSENIQVQFKWQGRGTWQAIPDESAVRIEGIETPLPRGWQKICALDCQCKSNLTGPQDIARLESIGILLLRATAPGAWLEISFTMAKKISGDVFVDLVNYLDRGVVRFYLDGKLIGSEYEHYSPKAVTVRVPLGRYELAAGGHRLRVEVVRKHPGVEKCYIGLAGLSLRPDRAPAMPQEPSFEIRMSDPVKVTAKGGSAEMEWLGATKNGQHRIFFSLIGTGSSFGEESLSCLRLADNAAVLKLPEPAIAALGDYRGLKGEFVLVSSDHLFGQGLREASVGAAVLSADEPVNVDWDFATGNLQLLTSKKARIRLNLAATNDLKMDGKPLKVERRRMERQGQTEKFVEFLLPAGRHTIINAKPRQLLLNELRQQLAALLALGREERRQLQAAISSPSKPAAPTLSAAFSTNVGGKVVDLITVLQDRGAVIYVAEGKTVHVLNQDGKELRTLQTDGPIRLLRWWQEHNLLLAGCADEKVMAFDSEGNRKWVFISEMDPAVFRAAKDYWFKSAPGHEGIHGLHTGTFLYEKSQAFVGSACTLEILDETGKLIKRLPVFWGPGSKFALIDGPEGSLNLLIARQPTDWEALAVINNRTLDPTPRSFYGVPAGHTYVGGWACMSRRHIFYEDLDDDGVKEVASEINGTWNRVTVWARDGTPLYNANFGPGESIPAQNIRDLDLADLEGDGKKEIVTATSSGLVLTLDYKCKKLWARHLYSPPTVLKCITPAGGERPWIVVGCDDGSVVVLDSRGEIIQFGELNGCPTCIDTLNELVILATDRGEVKGLRLGLDG